LGGGFVIGSIGDAGIIPDTGTTGKAFAGSLDAKENGDELRGDSLLGTSDALGVVSVEFPNKDDKDDEDFSPFSTGAVSGPEKIDGNIFVAELVSPGVSNSFADPTSINVAYAKTSEVMPINP